MTLRVHHPTGVTLVINDDRNYIVYKGQCLHICEELTEAKEKFNAEVRGRI